LSHAPDETPRVAAHRVKDIAHVAGFELVRIADVSRLEVEGSRFLDWLGEGRQGSMGWMTSDWARRASEPREAIDGAKSAICVGVSYATRDSLFTPPPGASGGRIARYAQGGDYHTFLGAMLTDLASAIEEQVGGESRCFVDTGPLMEKAIAARAGVGWFGKHTNLITPLGSYVVLGEIVTTLALEPDPPLDASCGSCRLCQIACPTGALDEDYRIDARRCISYLTIEHRAAIPRDLRPLMGTWVFGCDVCQEVCPPGNAPYLRSDADRRRWAQGLRRTVSAITDFARAPDGAKECDAEDTRYVFGRTVRDSVDLAWLLRLDHSSYLEAFRGTAIRRAKVWMLRRNAAVALGNVGDARSIPYLHEALLSDDHPLVRGHAAWAIGSVGRRAGVDVKPILRAALEGEKDASAQDEIRVAIAGRQEGIEGDVS